ncbi:MAG: DUF554 domain-containing protein [Clostridia bacterium]|nr:DUF554 domain-containing protein [Clostridia bacterium]
MMFLGTLVNCFAVIAGSGIGLLVKKGISEKISTSIMNALALCVLYIGVNGAFECQNVLVVIVSMALGTFIGEWIDLDARLDGLGQRLENSLGKGKEKGSISSGFVAASLLFCVGAMTIVGSLQSGISGNHETLFAKSLIDGIAGMVLASALGIGVMLSAVFVLVYQGLITLCAGFLEPVLTEVIVCEMTAVGSLLVVGLSFNMLKITKIKVMNSVPAMFVPIAVYWGIELFNYVFGG